MPGVIAKLNDIVLALQEIQTLVPVVTTLLTDFSTFLDTV